MRYAESSLVYHSFRFIQKVKTLVVKKIPNSCNSRTFLLWFNMFFFYFFLSLIFLLIVLWFINYYVHDSYAKEYPIIFFFVSHFQKTYSFFSFLKNAYRNCLTIFNYFSFFSFLMGNFVSISMNGKQIVNQYKIG